MLSGTRTPASLSAASKTRTAKLPASLPPSAVARHAAAPQVLAELLVAGRTAVEEVKLAPSLLEDKLLLGEGEAGGTSRDGMRRCGST